MKPFTALTIAGSDSGGGAGIQADLKTFEEWEVYGMSVLTSLTAQNTTGVQGVHHVPAFFIETQLTAIEEDLPVDVIKTGMIATLETAKMIGTWIARQNIPYVCDPVMVSASGYPLMEEETRAALSEYLFPYATVITPNIPEAETLLEMEISTERDMEEAAQRLVKEFGAGGALVKGGHLDGEAVDVLYDGEEVRMYREDKILTENTHGTGCTYASAIAANLAMKRTLSGAVEQAKPFITEAIRYSFDIGSGKGPTNHWAYRKEREQ
ncbi:hydroxymethylpyrimidine/phosphomethylpyrimidine kinase [Alkalibacillus flavidus]|uniref:Hydroxymethylpyrimidine/phosphomethylpyrimidine kinase n=1 Tax=Alkalibacillus flavidus TaxID=546021 RepID=A0ABV2KTL5_9BACI